MKKRVLSILLCAAVILSLTACKSGGETNGSEPPTDGRDAQQNAETAEPQDTETAASSGSGTLTDKTPLYLGGDITVTTDDFDIVLATYAGGGEGLIEFDDFDTVNELTVGFTNIYPNLGFGYEVEHEITLGAGNITVSELYRQMFEQLTAATDSGYFSYTADTFISDLSNLKDNGRFRINFLDEEFPDEEPLELNIEEVDYITIFMPVIDSSRVEMSGSEHNISPLTARLGVPR